MLLVLLVLLQTLAQVLPAWSNPTTSICRESDEDEALFLDFDTVP